MSLHPQVKVVGNNGQLSLGKEFAGQMVLIEQLDKGTWLIKKGEFIADSEKWLYQADNLAKLDKALSWAETNNPNENFDEIAKKIEND
ncbi:hypothetical protein Trichorick_01693 (plasmid) [Candidatus Trichorickettsia mobilis]|jgi:hypothetical protein|uniref:hypothetical protein n=1 Tax=Candidatus Trichorickettsia mobilis TaxID=1346319 RepID=UPI002B264440|nr:hypothetical protein [Candidatus Trichorickettsia mobilis]WPY01775.1 hypothetical protein Trichorick_01693 [Candidatus Trichorickettsia mobilis]